MKSFDLKNIVKNLIGRIDPVGDNGVDECRLQNLKELCELTESLIIQIDNIAHIESYELSVRRCVKYADDFLKEIHHHDIDCV